MDRGTHKLPRAYSFSEGPTKNFRDPFRYKDATLQLSHQNALILSPTKQRKTQVGFFLSLAFFYSRERKREREQRKTRKSKSKSKRLLWSFSIQSPILSRFDRSPLSTFLFKSSSTVTVTRFFFQIDRIRIRISLGISPIRVCITLSSLQFLFWFSDSF